jgi:two-component system, OmpR family, sensor kinase
MASLRTRLLAGVLVLAAAGLVLLAAVTYAEQRSFLLGRVDEEARSAVGAISRVLDSHGFKPPANTAANTAANPPAGDGGGGRGRGGPGATGAGGFPGAPAPGSGVILPPGTYGQRRLSSGKVLGELPIRFGTTESIGPPPSIPAKVAIGQPFTVHAVGHADIHYRVYVARDPEDVGLTAVAIPLADVDQTLNRLLLVEGLVIGGVLLALGLTAFFVVRLGLRPLDRMEVTAGAIAGGDLSRRVSPATARTEVGRLGLALNRMLDRLEDAFAERQASEDRLRQFLADASHELRTPLASIRGYAELFRMGATRNRDDTALAMRRIEDEARRMGVLVEDLLTLARLDEAPALRREPVDLAKMARDAVTDARATAPERPISVQTPDAAVVSGDPHQLHQVLANLMRNALVHTPGGSPIEVSVRPNGQIVEIEVRDHGAGLPEGARERLFERFWRAEAGRERGKAGAGLGLAIVHDIVVAHHGSVIAGDAPGGGAQFIVELPVAAPAPTP